MQKKLELLKKYKGYIICIIIILMASLSIFIQSKQKNEKGNSNNSNNIGVYITGEIVNSGVYYLKSGSRLYELIDIAGGLSDMADINKLNLAQALKDSDKIEIPKKENESEAEIGINDKNDTNLDNNKININVATKEELMKLNGIGASTADKIIKYREKNVFTCIEDIMDVPGIGESKFNSIEDSISVD